MRMLFLALTLLMGALITVIVIWHPIGWVGSIGVAAAVYAAYIFAAVKLARGIGRKTSEEEQIALDDKILGMNKRPKNWFFMP